MEFGTLASFSVRLAQIWHRVTERLCSSVRRRLSRRFSSHTAQAAPRGTGRNSAHFE